ncbi:MAG TPA: hemerythrin family protein [Burkholderiales bacterium]|jgi:hemerythrin-like metal-binding protein|nr:hemerythrin family protein [Burkholderiales bacterium]
MIEWNDQLHLGHEALDDHHKEMVNAANLLYAAHLAGTREAVLSHLHALIAASTEHFVFEEELMAQIKYPKALVHTEHHGEVLAQLNRFFDRVIANNVADADKVLAFLREWLTSHLVTFDRDLVQFMSRP